MQDQDHIVTDPEVRAVKTKMMNRLRQNSLLNSVSTIGALIGGPLFAAGIMGVASALFGKVAVTAAATTAATTTATTAAASAGMFAAIGGLPVVAMLVVGALFVGISVASAYKASRIWQSKQFDNFEVGAKSTAHHLVQELKANNMCLVNEHEHEANRRADGKSWVVVMRERGEQAMQQLTRN